MALVLPPFGRWTLRDAAAQCRTPLHYTSQTPTMACVECESVVERPDLPHVVRQCPGCERSLCIHEPGEHGIGFKIQKGDQVVIPQDWLKISLNPLKSTGQLSRAGVQWFASLIHLDDLPKKKNDVPSEIDRLENKCDEILGSSQLLTGLDMSNPDHADDVVARLKERHDSIEWWAFLVGTFIAFLREAIDTSDVHQAVWAMGCVERCRSMLVFKEHLEEVVWMGHSAKRIVDILARWDTNKSNADEGFWQITFRENVYALSQVFAVPLLFIQESAYVGGMKVDQRSAKLVDYLFSQESSREAVLIEIKTPAASLLGSRYRGTYKPSAELAGSVMQVLDYRRTLSKNLSAVTDGTNHKLSAFAPKCVVVIGNGALELDTESKRSAFEMFRANSKDVEIVTYDELFGKLEILASLFNLTRTKAKTQ